jgi:integrase
MSTDRETSYDVRIWSVKTYERRSGRTYGVRWSVAGKPFHRTYRTKALAEAARAELLSKTRLGQPFDTVTGLPASMLPIDTGPTWYAHACAFVDSKWPGLAPKSRKSIAEALATITPAMLRPARGRPPDDVVREALYGWAFNSARRQAGPPPARLVSVVEWIGTNSLPVLALNDAGQLRRVLDSLAKTSVGKPASANTIKRWRAGLRGAVGYAVELGHLPSNPLARVKWKPPKVAEAVDPRSVVNHHQARALFAAVAEQGEIGRHLVAFFALMYYAALRPAEVIAIRHRDLVLPEKGWGELRLDGSNPNSGVNWTDTGKRTRRQLKHRAVQDVRVVPCPPQLTAILHEHIARYDPPPDGLLFRGSRGGPVPDHAYGRVWQAAREKALTPEEAASPLAAVPYHLRHAAVSTWLNAGVDATQVAEWAGHSLNVLLKVYAKCITGRGELHRRRIEDILHDPEE